jgi:hypothetical protein
MQSTCGEWPWSNRSYCDLAGADICQMNSDFPPPVFFGGAKERLAPTDIALPSLTVDHGLGWSLMLIVGKCMPITACCPLGAGRYSYWFSREENT